MRFLHTGFRQLFCALAIGAGVRSKFSRLSLIVGSLVCWSLLLQHCSLVGLDQPQLAMCSRHSDCESLNIRQGISLGACSRYRCSTVRQVCELEITDNDDDGDPPVQCGGTDCNDSSPNQFGGANARMEVCDGVDNDCDGAVDEEIQRTYYRDRDGDGFGDTASAMVSNSCEEPTGYSSVPGDCNDTNSQTYPGALEICDRVDNDCSLSGVMSGGVDPSEDMDEDGHGPITSECIATSVFPKDDCDDSDASIHPGVADPCDGIDNDCSANNGNPNHTEPSEDQDSDGYPPVNATCDRGEQQVDCNDTNPLVFPGQRETCDGIDNNCVNGIDELPEAETNSCVVGVHCVAGQCQGMAIGAGAEHTCAVSTPGVVYCWGIGSFNVVGSGTYDPSVPLPVSRVEGVRDAVAVTAGLFHSCALRRGGTVRCWGANSSMALGSLGSSLQQTALEVPGLSNVTGLDAGDNHTCAVRQDGTVWCWGQNQSYQLGVSSALMSLSPVMATGVSGASSVSAGRSHSCAVTTSGVYCWGGNSDGQTGIPGSTTRTTAVLVAGLGTVSKVAAGDYHTCVLETGTQGANNSVSCWGLNGSGQLGDGSTNSRHTPQRVQFPDGTQIVDIRAGGAHTCALASSGQVYCWGRNDRGQLARSEPAHSPVPLAIESVSNATALSCGYNHNCVRLGSGAISCWGDNGEKQVSFGVLGTVFEPTIVEGLYEQLDLVAGSGHTCARRVDGRVYCWGRNEQGQLGLGNTTGQPRPRRIEGLENVTWITAGDYHTCAVLSSGEARCWGRNFRGQLGNNMNTREPVPTPQSVVGVPAMMEVHAGLEHTCAITETQQVYCWGDNLLSQIAPTGTTYMMPRRVTEVANVAHVGVGREFTCVVSSAASNRNNVICWGSNAQGELSVGGAPEISLTAPVTIGADAEDFSLGANHGCSRTKQQTVYCWGRNAAGQTGNGMLSEVNTGSETAPQVRNVIAVQSGAQHSCALQRDGVMLCWGANSSGVLANATTASTIPIYVGGLYGVTSITRRSSDHQCAVGRTVGRNSPQLYCWGANDYGQLGTGDLFRQIVPVPVEIFSLQ